MHGWLIGRWRRKGRKKNSHFEIRFEEKGDAREKISLMTDAPVDISYPFWGCFLFGWYEKMQSKLSK